MMWKLKLYRISADGGNSWTTQWLTDEEAAEQKKTSLCELIPFNEQEIYA